MRTQFERIFGRVIMILLHIFFGGVLFVLAKSLWNWQIYGITASLVVGVITLFTIATFHYERVGK